MFKPFVFAGALLLAASNAWAVNDISFMQPVASGAVAEEVSAKALEESIKPDPAAPSMGREVVRGKLAEFAGRAERLIDTSLGLLGIRYKWGGNNESEGFDCSGFVKKVFETSIGLSLPRTALEMSRRGQKVQKAELKPGDLVFFNTLKRSFSHVGIYLGANRFIHAPRAGAFIRVDDMQNAYWTKRFNGARRMMTSADKEAAAPLLREAARAR